MKNPFKTTGFDSVISKGTVLTGDIALAQKSTTLLDGEIKGEQIYDTLEQLGPKGTTTLIVNGAVDVVTIRLPNVTIHGTVNAETLMVYETLAIKKGAVLKASKIYYNILVIETGAEVHGQLIKIGSTEPV
jgi:cytoskeletal protein CcmA (bactofilin family)